MFTGEALSGKFDLAARSAEIIRRYILKL
jgi:hypothetical protein